MLAGHNADDHRYERVQEKNAQIAKIVEENGPPQTSIENKGCVLAGYSSSFYG
jgi:hypothetical protein